MDNAECGEIVDSGPDSEYIFSVVDRFSIVLSNSIGSSMQILFKELLVTNKMDGAKKFPESPRKQTPLVY